MTPCSGFHHYFLYPANTHKHMYIIDIITLTQMLLIVLDVISYYYIFMGFSIKLLKDTRANII